MLAIGFAVYKIRTALTCFWSVSYGHWLSSWEKLQDSPATGNYFFVMTKPTTHHAHEPEGPPSRIDWQQALIEHDRWLRTVVHARVGEAQAVDEVMQEVSLAAVRQAAPINDPTKVAPWLYQLAVRQSLMYRRKCGRRRKLNERVAARQRPTDCDERTLQPLDWLIADERQRIIREALKKLPSSDAEILLLKYTENWSYHQIADHLGVSHSAVESRLHRARAKMRKALVAQELVEVD